MEILFVFNIFIMIDQPGISIHNNRVITHRTVEQILGLYITRFNNISINRSTSVTAYSPGFRDYYIDHHFYKTLNWHNIGIEKYPNLNKLYHQRMMANGNKYRNSL